MQWRRTSRCSREENHGAAALQPDGAMQRQSDARSVERHAELGDDLHGTCGGARNLWVRVIESLYPCGAAPSPASSQKIPRKSFPSSIQSKLPEVPLLSTEFEQPRQQQPRAGARRRQPGHRR
ncbi:hypothetical protein TRIUR3_15988 [Triticum urartu]|uniref:Uncharacterized protein n=1 Tax=Triticum urartu TaxID=4572 RepID=M7YRL5_TRIUA|nr:hypothetical protein TRIUR3_15988 [Triticum urartu]